MANFKGYIRGLLCGAALLLSNQALGLCLDTFEENETAGSWSFGTWHAEVVNEGGTHGAYLRDGFLESSLPRLVNINDDTCFEGNYKARKASELRFDLKVLDVTGQESYARPASLILWQNNGTPNNYDDDWGAVLVTGQNILSSRNWQTISFFIPYKGDEIPHEWMFVTRGANAEPSWEKLMTDVSYFTFYLGNPLDRYNYQQWVIGVDNIELKAVSDR